MAACETDGSAVTCSGTTTVTQAEAAAAAAAAGATSVSFSVLSSANVVQPDSELFVLTAADLAFSNAGTIGTEAAPVSVRLASDGSDVYDLAIANSGEISGAFIAHGWQGAVTVDNSGTVAGISVFAAGPVAVTATGDVGAPGAGGIVANSLELEFENESTSDTVDGVTTTTNAQSGGNVSTGESSVTVGSNATVGWVSAVAPAGVSIDVDGTVGSEDQGGFVQGFANGSFYEYDDVTVSDPANGLFSASYVESEASNGDSITIAIGAEGSVYGPVFASANTDASIDNAGLIAGNVTATAQGFESTDTFSGESFIDPDGATEQSSATATASFTQTGGIASVTNAAGGLIGLDQDNRVHVAADGIGGAEFVNHGRANADVTVRSAGFASTELSESTAEYNYDTDTGALTDSTVTSAGEETTTEIGGAASFTNGANGLIVGNVQVSGVGGVEIVNNGAVTGYTDARSHGVAETDSWTDISENVYAEDGSRTLTETYTTASTDETVGGNVSGTYAGSNGAVQFAPGDASNGSIYQLANGTNSAAISGLVLGNVTLNAESYSNTTQWTEVEQSQFDDAGLLTALNRSQTSAGSFHDGDASATLAVNGGTVEGRVEVSATGTAAVALGNGALITNDLQVLSSGDDYEYQTVSDLAQAYDGGALVSEVSSFELTEAVTSNSGDVSLTMGEATVEGEVLLSTEAGAVSATIGADAVIGGDLDIFAGGSTSTSTVSDSITIDADGSTRDYVYRAEGTGIGGDVTATVAGAIGDDLNVDGSNLTVVVSGTVGDEIELEAAQFTSTSSWSQSYVDGLLVSNESAWSSTAVGGSASLSIVANEAGDPTNYGNVEVYGVADATLEIGEGAVVALEGSVSVSTESVEHAQSYFSSYEDGDVVTVGQTWSSTVTGGPALLVNGGVIGDNGGTFHSGANADVYVGSFESASVENTGSIYGDVTVRSLGTNTTGSYVEEGFGDVLQTRTTERTYVPVGGTASLANGGLITGEVSMAAAEGAVTNDGVIRDGISLGASVDNYATTQLDTFTQDGEEEVTEAYPAFVQSYTVDQNGLLGGGITVEGAFGLIDDSVMTSAIDATVNLNGGSVTTGTILAEYDDETGERYTDTTVNLVGAGYLGLSDANAEDLSDAFAAADPRIAAFGDLGEYVGGARVLGVETLAKSGEGAFVFHGASFAPQSDTNAVADWTVDAGLVSIDGGELQLSTDDGVFGIRGDLVNASSLVLGERVRMPQPLFGSNLTTGGLELVDGIEIYQQGNFTQTTAGALSVGMMPSLVRYVPSAVDPVGYSNELLGVQFIDMRQGLFTTAENALGEHADFGDSFVTLDGDLNLAGTVNLVMPRGGIFADGEKLDLFSVSGTVAQSASVVTQDDMNFVSFGLTTRQEGGRTIVSVGATRIGYDTVATNSNAAAAGAALSASVPNLVAALRADAEGEGTFGSVRELALAQDLATVVAGFDSLLTKSQVAVALNELASGEFYGSLTTVETTAPFIDAISNRRTAQGQGGFGLWLAPSGDFAKFDGDEETGASDISVDNYGGSMGFSVSTGAAEFGLGGGYGHIEADSEGQPVSATADTWMVGAYGQYASGPIFVGANVVFGWSDWDAARSLPTFGREAEGTFDSKELRADLRGEYRFDLGTAFVAPFAEAQIRRYDFDGFTEEGAGALGLVVGDAEKTVFTPSIGVKFGTAFTTDLAVIRPEASLSYSFRGDNDAFRDVAYAGAPSQSFRLQGVDPDGFVTGKLGLFADIGANSGAFVRGSYSKGGGTDIAGLNAGVSIGF